MRIANGLPLLVAQILHQCHLGTRLVSTRATTTAPAQRARLKKGTDLSSAHLPCRQNCFLLRLPAKACDAFGPHISKSSQLVRRSSSFWVQPVVRCRPRETFHPACVVRALLCGSQKFWVLRPRPSGHASYEAMPSSPGRGICVLLGFGLRLAVLLPAQARLRMKAG